VVIVGPVLRYDPYRSAAVASILGGIRARGHLHFFDGFLTRRDHGGSAPCLAIHAGAVDLKIIRREPLSIGDDRDLILRSENADVRTAGAGRIRQ
jgi:hypothetical protein